MKAHELAEVNLKQGDDQIQLKLGGQAPVGPFAAPAPAAPAPPALAPSGDAPPTPAPAAAAEAANIVTINSPMIGTYYSRPNPDSDAFVKVGDRVEPETVVCIIEAMKVFNEIPAEMAGVVLAVLVENEEAVEYGTPLLKVDTSR
jgi:acetyl-CoA carboxylase biotin carboxyl carrier protein